MHWTFTSQHQGCAGKKPLQLNMLSTIIGLSCVLLLCMTLCLALPILRTGIKHSQKFSLPIGVFFLALAEGCHLWLHQKRPFGPKWAERRATSMQTGTSWIIFLMLQLFPSGPCLDNVKYVSRQFSASYCSTLSQLVYFQPPLTSYIFININIEQTFQK